MDNLQVGEGLFAFFRQRLIGKPGIRKLCIAPFGRKFDGMQQCRERRRVIRLIRMPEVIAVGERLVGGLAVRIQVRDRMNLRSFRAVMLAYHMVLQFAELLREGGLRLFRKLLIAKDENVMLQESVSDELFLRLA